MRAAGEALLNSRDFFHDQSALNALEVFQAAGEAVDHSLQEAGGESAGVEFEVVALIHTEAWEWTLHPRAAQISCPAWTGYLPWSCSL